MKIGIPREIKNHEYRVAITPAGVHELTERGHEVIIESEAGIGSSFADEDFKAAGAHILQAADQVWDTADLLLKAIIDCCRCGAADGSVFPITINTRQFRCNAFDANHFRPLSTYSSPSRTIDNSTFVASELATAGSVIANADAIVPSSNGVRYFSLCSAVPNNSSTSILPVSGALQLHASDAIWLRPMISANGAYSRFVNPAPVPGCG